MLHLLPERITETLERLEGRIEKRFGADSGLLEVCRHLTVFSKDTARVMDDIARPMWWLRGSLGGLVLLAIVAGVAMTAMRWLCDCSTAGLIPGSIPTKGSPGQMSRRWSIAQAVAVLQATTIKPAP